MTVTQSEFAGELMMQPLAGLWSSLPLEPGTELVLFAKSAVSRVQRVVTEPGLRSVALAVGAP